MKKHLGTLLIIVGLAIVAFPFVGKYIADQRQKAMMEAFYLETENMGGSEEAIQSLDDIFSTTNTVEGQEALDEALEEIGEIALDGGSIEVGETEDAGYSMTLTEQLEILGVINIPKIDLRAPIAEGADLDTLRFAIGHMENTTRLGQVGNAVVAGHRSHSFGIYFNRLDELEIGDEIVVETASGQTVTYVIYETKLVLPDDVSVLRSSSQYKVLTLITCDPVYNPTHRLIVHAIDKDQM